MSTQQIKGKDVKRGMIVKIYGDTKVQVETVKKERYWGGIVLTGMDGKTHGISEDEDIELLGHFNP